METLRLCEWSSRSADKSFWTRERREAVQRASADWRDAHRLNALPLEWGGTDGCTLTSRQWVGVVEIDGGRIEIYPKTDAALIKKNAPNDQEAQSTLSTLLRMLEISSYGDWVEADRTALAVAELTFVDLWAYMLARHLWPQLRRGLPSAYLAHEDELPAVRGQILLNRQLARFGDRIDRVVCRWDEFSADTPMLRLIKCACRFLRRRAGHPLAMGLLGDCVFMLDEVADVAPAEALRSTERLVFSRANERFRPVYELARRILAGQGPQLNAGEHGAWVFLVDMNQVFEAFCRAAIEDALGVVVQEQQTLGHLLRNPARRPQKPDYCWQHNGKEWIGDAKWKRLSSDLIEGEDDEVPVSKATLSTADIRQLTTYADLASLNAPRGEPQVRADLAVFYPAFAAGCAVQVHEAWNGSRLHLVPVSFGDLSEAGKAVGGFGGEARS